MKNLFEKLKTHPKKKLIIILTSVAAAVVVLVAAFCIFWFTRPCVHEYDDGKVIKDPTCVEEGSSEYTCKLCGYVEERSVPVIEHKFLPAEEIKAATCGKDGEKLLVCELCGFEEKEPIPATGEHEYTEVVTKEATCIEKGMKEQVCDVCGAVGKTEETELAEHKYTETVTSNSTCTAEGSKTLTCSVCGKSETQTIAATGHNYERTVEVYNTCTTAGTYKYTCSSCSNSYTEAIPAGGHRWVKATCTAPKTCTACGITEGSALGHTTQAGTCSRCGTYINTSKMVAYPSQEYPLGLYHHNFPYFITAPTFSYGEMEADGTMRFSWSVTMYMTDVYPVDYCIGYIIYNSKGEEVCHSRTYIPPEVSKPVVVSDSVYLVPGEYSIYFINTD